MKSTRTVLGPNINLQDGSQHFQMVVNITKSASKITFAAILKCLEIFLGPKLFLVVLLKSFISLKTWV